MKKKFLFISFLALSTIAHTLFVVPERIKNDVDFWAKVYREWDNHQVIFYDSKTKLIYDVVNLPKIENEISSLKYKNDVSKKHNEIIGILKKIVGKKSIDKKDVQTTNIYQILKKHALTSDKDLPERLRHQNGLRGQFEYGLKISGRYADEMKALLKAHGLPEELLAMVFVESLFYLSAMSSAGASGPWGFLKETAINSGIHVNNFINERQDWVISTLAAANYLKRAKQGLSEWPLIITSYNYGYSGMKRAVNNLGTKDFSTILDNHESPIFGYASKSYYAEFLAALDTLKNHVKYFPKLKKDEICKYDLVQIKRPLAIDDMISAGAIAKEDLLLYNPGLTKRTMLGQEVIPKDFVLRVPNNKGKHFYDRLKTIPHTKREKAGLKVSSRYTAKGKENLSYIAKIFGISAEFLSQKMNKPLRYRPKGAVLIRSQAHLFTPLPGLTKSMPSVVASK
jgi:membrane-bound lytic murein transglycosylase D